MGIFDFIRGAGEDVGLNKKDTAAADEAQAELRRGNEILRFIGEAQLGIDKPKVRYDDGVVTVWGTASSQAVRENTILAIGNLVGVERVEDHIEVDNPEPESVFYTVQKGDTLGAIAKAHLGDASRYPEIFEANRPMLKDPNLIYPGQVLRIPQA